ncbi:SnoaL-like protein [Antricoccus suffuscus]|uniref:SnoaL-like protein n=1 Tax=Antricoccus suffuscus TaxID=1629062 RepID=A0A2T0ZVY8_9ACTN|nr:nuclear transport factor 2 family protein [Antricoccus suffuscus]PRZ40464.1 SnoaL-like protein [Antricoccus suffuscus]
MDGPERHDYERIVREFEDKARIERLFRTYADACDEGYNPELLGPLFTEDAVWAASSESGTSDFGVYEGRAAIIRHFSGASARIPLSHHIAMSPQIDIVVPGKEATGRWNTIVFMKLAADPLSERDDEAMMIAAVYRHEYRCEDGNWLISRLDVHTRFDTRIRQVG